MGKGFQSESKSGSRSKPLRLVVMDFGSFGVKTETNFCNRQLSVSLSFVFVTVVINIIVCELFLEQFCRHSLHKG